MFVAFYCLIEWLSGYLTRQTFSDGLIISLSLPLPMICRKKSKSPELDGLSLQFEAVVNPMPDRKLERSSTEDLMVCDCAGVYRRQSR